jgi:transcriptional regulator with XRE-family HTH domain
MSPVNVPAIGAYIREQREQAKISLRQLAEAAGVSNPYLSQIERGLRRPSADILQQIARGLACSRTGRRGRACARRCSPIRN